MFNPTDRLAVDLEAQQWNQIMAILHESGPYRTVAPLVQSIGEQLREHERPDNVVPMEIS